MREAVSLRDLYEQYSQQIQFLVVYIREAHAMDGWDIGSEYRLRDPTTLEERQAAASMCEVGLQYGIKTYVDEMDDAVMLQYVAWPERLYLVGQDGRLVYAGGPGPGGFAPAELKDAIERELTGAEKEA
ncbi:MAG: hypothetical protein GKR89_04245 [Candidatus Latescibacteria bacterium]|nr:hypothetical protein [Candidatus Latescibacterota bacterium]